ncbi:hypothetical protein [Bacillus altitudinis]|uniref:hypothetical protein n=1 Tax=Bacillus altitudinis TaxID=293387 RepID=UPI001E2EAE86|nr:hypothetical protein [Bacillus altitudinis]
MNLLKKWLNTEPYLIIMLIVLTPIGGELKFYPFEDSFRVSFGTVVFFFILLQMKKFPAWASGIIAGDPCLHSGCFLIPLCQAT